MSPSLRDPDSHGDAAARSACAEGQSVGGASAASALGSTQSYCFTPRTGDALGDSAERRRDRWGARAMLWQASSLKAVRCCGRMLHNDGVRDPDDGQMVGIRRREVAGGAVASYQGLMTCGSVWSCPRCAVVIAHTRADEIGAAVRECHRQGGKVYLLTLTMRHTKKDRLDELWDALSAGWRSAFGTRKWTGQRETTVERRGKLAVIPARVGDSELFDIAGITRVVEATYGAPDRGGHGWHLHVHALVFSASGLASALRSDLSNWCDYSFDRDWLGRNAFASRVHDRWSAGVQRAGYLAPGSVAVDVREVAQDGADYVGRYLAKATYSAASSMGMEIGAGQLSKAARTQRNRTPFEILSELAASVDSRGFGVRTPRQWAVKEALDGDWAVIDTETGEVVAVTPPGEWAVWHEWERASKGRRQIVWSRRRSTPSATREQLWNSLLDARGTSAAQTDEEVASAETDGELLGEISRADWYRIVVWRPELVANVLEAAEIDGGYAVECLLRRAGVEMKRPPPRQRPAA